MSFGAYIKFSPVCGLGYLVIKGRAVSADVFAFLFAYLLYDFGGSFFIVCYNLITKSKPNEVGLIWRGKRKEHSGTFARRAKEERCEFLLTRGSSDKKS